MKQHITKSQLNELSTIKKGKLIVYLQNHNIKWRLLDNDVMTKPLLNIGQMIEFLDKVDIDVRCVYGIQSGTGFINGNRNEEELCDALWSACKEKLNET